MKQLNELKWKAFDIHDVFPDVKRGKRLKTDDHIEGNMAYVSSSALNNGVDNFIGNEDGVRIFDNCVTLANSGSVGTAFYHPYKFVASDHVTKLKNKAFNKHIYLFIATVANRLSEKYSFNREINDKRLGREKIMLPIDENEQPNYAFMEAYMKAVEKRLLAQYKDYIMRVHNLDLNGGG
ncbi:MAG: restriction endonuclease subunit S [Prevotella sp.]|nr:restriction endonuclease subunit S [Prevotella sp.]